MIIKATRTTVVALHPAIEHAMNVVTRVWAQYTDSQPICTGLQEEGHSNGSRHYGVTGDVRCRAFDIRIAGLTDTQRLNIENALKSRLAHGLEFDVLWKSNHLHIEYDPK